MARYTTIKNDSKLYNLGAWRRVIALPVKTDCSPTRKDWLLTECNEQWNCTKKKFDLPYYLPFESGDIIMLQTLFNDGYNINPKNPSDTDLIDISFLDEGGDVVDGLTISNICKVMVGWNGEQSYQVISIDTAQLPNDLRCFTVMIKAIKAVRDGYGNVTSTSVSDQVCTEHFRIVECDTTIKVRSLYDRYDCFGNWYGAPITYAGDYLIYNNTLRYDGFIRDSGMQVTKEADGDNITSITTRKTFDLTLRNPIPPYLKNTLYGQHFSGLVLLVDGIEYKVTEAQTEAFGNMFKVQQEVWQECSSGKMCN